MPCDKNEVNNGQIITEVFQGDLETRTQWILYCFRKCHYEYCEATALQDVFSTRYKLRNRAKELCDLAFTDALEYFYFYIRKTGFVQEKATIRTYFYQIFYFKLLNQINRGGRKKAKPATPLPSEPKKNFETLMEDSDYNEDDYIIFEQAWEQLNERDKNLIVMRKIHKLTNEEIADKLKNELPENDPAILNPALFTNRVYQAMGRLQVIVDGLKNNNL